MQQTDTVQTVDSATLTSSSLLNVSLGLEENSTAVVTQTGQLVTIDPDDDELCNEYLDGDVLDTDEYQQCLAVVAHITVTVNSLSEDKGDMVFLYKNEPVLSIGYAPDAASYTLSFDGIKVIEEEVLLLQGDGSVVAQQLTGAIQLSASYNPDAPEVVKISFDVTRDIAFATNTGDSLSFAQGKILEIETFADDGTGKIEMSMGALSYRVTDEKGERGEVSMAGLTGRADLTRDGELLKVTNLGLKNGPLTVTIGSADLLRIAMENLGFSVDQQTEELVLDSNLNIDLFAVTNRLYSPAQTGADYQVVEGTVNARLVASAGTGLLRQIAATKVTQGGPISIDILDTNAIETLTTSLVVGAGQCFGDDQDDSNGELDLVACNVP